MSLLNQPSINNIFQPNQKYLKFYNSDILCIAGANPISALPLCDIKLSYDDFMRTQIQVPKGQTDYKLTFPMLGINSTFIFIKVNYQGTDLSLNYLRWKFVSDSGPKHSMTNLLMFTGTVCNPIQEIVVDNPNPDSPVVIDVLITSVFSDNLNDVTAFIYLQNLTFDKVHTFNETTTSILAFFDQDSVLAGTINFNDINNVTRVVGLNRIIITELGNDNNIILDFTDNTNTLQALSAINWVLLDGSTRFLPQPEDLLPPVITYTNLIVSNILNVDLTTFGFSYNKQNFINNTMFNCCCVSVYW